MERDLTGNIWSISKESKRTWWWWFWLFFFKDPRDPGKPRQIMILWSVKDEKLIMCNDYPLRMGKDILVKGKECTFEGATASWYYDGKEMHEDFLLEQTKMLLRGDGKRELKGGNSKFIQKGDRFRVIIDGKQAKAVFNLKMQKAFPAIEKANQFLHKFGYYILKINRLQLKGHLQQKGRKEKISGSAYFQKVGVDGPAIPWQWGMVHFENGSFLTYNITKLGQSLFQEHHSPLDITLRKKLDFYDAVKKKLHHFRDLKLTRSPGKLPVWKLQAKSADAELSAELQTYSRALWRLRKSTLNTLYYHEFCVAVKEFSLKTNEGKITLRDLGGGYGNCEDSKGMLI